MTELILLAEKLAQLAASKGIKNIFQPGIVKECVIANILGHQVLAGKRNADAFDDLGQYEYLTCEGGSGGQLDRMFRHPPDKRAKSLERLTRNRKIYLVIFDQTVPLQVNRIYELDPTVCVAETERQLDASSNQISHVSFRESWAKQHGREVKECGIIHTLSDSLIGM
jgi:hypothetical protein